MTLLPNAVNSLRFPGVYSCSSANIVLNMIKILFSQKFDVFFGFVYLFAFYICIRMYEAIYYTCEGKIRIISVSRGAIFIM